MSGYNHYELDPIILGAPPIKIDHTHSFSQFPPYVPPLQGLSDYKKNPDGSYKLIREDNPLETYYSFPVQLISSFGLGFVLAAFSNGFRFYVAYSIVAELWYAFRIGGKYTPPQIIYRLGLFAVGFIGFILGRLLIGDRYPMRPVYKQQFCRKQIEEDAEAERKKRDRKNGTVTRNEETRNEETGNEETRDEETRNEEETGGRKSDY